jgi:hypothetical protein
MMKAIPIWLIPRKEPRSLSSINGSFNKGVSDSTSLLNPDGVVYLHKAYRLINSGHDFQMPSRIMEIEDAVNYARMELATAGKKLRVGQTDECVRRLLEVAVMIVTPMQR